MSNPQNARAQSNVPRKRRYDDNIADVDPPREPRAQRLRTVPPRASTIEPTEQRYQPYHEPRRDERQQPFWDQTYRPRGQAQQRQENYRNDQHYQRPNNQLLRDRPASASSYSRPQEPAPQPAPVRRLKVVPPPAQPQRSTTLPPVNVDQANPDQRSSYRPPPRAALANRLPFEQDDEDDEDEDGTKIDQPVPGTGPKIHKEQPEPAQLYQYPPSTPYRSRSPGLFVSPDSESPPLRVPNNTQRREGTTTINTEGQRPPLSGAVSINGKDGQSRSVATPNQSGHNTEWEDVPVRGNARSTPQGMISPTLESSIDRIQSGRQVISKSTLVETAPVRQPISLTEYMANREQQQSGVRTEEYRQAKSPRHIPSPSGVVDGRRPLGTPTRLPFPGQPTIFRRAADSIYSRPMPKESASKQTTKMTAQSGADATNDTDHGTTTLPVRDTTKRQVPTQPGSQQAVPTNPSHRKKLGQITKLDCILLQLTRDSIAKHGKPEWDSIKAAHEEYGAKKNTTIAPTSRRHAQLQKAFEAADVRAFDLDAVAGGDKQMEDDLNTYIQSKLDVNDTFYGSEQAGDDLVTASVVSRRNAATPATDVITSPKQALGAVEPASNLVPVHPGSMQGLERALGSHNVSGATDEDPQGQIYYNYQVQRRQTTDAAISLDDVEWLDVDGSLTSSSEASNRVLQAVLVSRRDPAQSFTLTHEKDEKTGLASWLYKDHHGIVQTRIVCTTRHRAVQLVDDGQWLPRTLYYIKIRQTDRVEDDANSQGVVSHNEERYLDDCVSSDLDWTNNKAIIAFADACFESASTDADLVESEKAALVASIRQAFEESGQALFKQQGKTARETIEVFVVKGKLCGPRNV